MTKEEILENNKLIAEFMEIITKHPVWQYRTHGNEWKLEGLKYHKSWNWLMPVLEKCLSSSCEGHDWDHHYEQMHDALWSLNIKSLYEVIVKFIIWYNEQNKGSSTD